MTLCTQRKHVRRNGASSCDCAALITFPTADGSGLVIILVGMSVQPAMRIDPAVRVRVADTAEPEASGENHPDARDRGAKR